MKYETFVARAIMFVLLVALYAIFMQWLGNQGTIGALARIIVNLLLLSLVVKDLVVGLKHRITK